SATWGAGLAWYLRWSRSTTRGLRAIRERGFGLPRTAQEASKLVSTLTEAAFGYAGTSTRFSRLTRMTRYAFETSRPGLSLAMLYSSRSTRLPWRTPTEFRRLPATTGWARAGRLRSPTTSPRLADRR